jgi:hypothetical protein
MSTKTQLQWRRAKVLELSAQGYSQVEIASQLHNKQRHSISKAASTREPSKTYHEVVTTGRVPKMHGGINQVLNMAWSIVNKSVVDDKTRLQALALINDCNKYKMDLTTNGVVITDAGRSSSSMYRVISLLP